MTALDGRLISLVTHQTEPFTLIISGNHCELIQPFVITSLLNPVVLGCSWLKRHNPHIDWSTLTITGWSSFCHVHCLQSAVPKSRTSQPAPSPPDLSAVPPEYHSLAPVFSKDPAQNLPPHHPYDCAINLLPGAPLPTNHLYNLSRPEKEAMEAHIKDSLASGFIRPSSSPVGAGFIFVKKKDSLLRPCIDF